MTDIREIAPVPRETLRLIVDSEIYGYEKFRNQTQAQVNRYITNLSALIPENRAEWHYQIRVEVED